MKPGVRNTVLILFVVVLSISAGSFFSLRTKIGSEQETASVENHKFDTVHGNVLSPHRKISVPQLVKHDGSAFTGEDLQGHWSILYFGFTNCGYICPTAMSVLAQSKKMAEEQKFEFPQVFMVSVDPERDDPAAMRKFVKGFDGDFNGVTGDERLIKALSLQMSVVFMKAAAENTDNQSEKSDTYQVDHSSSFLLMDKQGNLAAFLNPSQTPQKVLQDVRTILGAS